jgi:CubicO group peptidase (beta-lactamase class C family)
MTHGIDRRQVLRWSGGVAAGVPLLNAVPAIASTPDSPDPAGSAALRDRVRAYDRYVASLAADGRFSGVVLLSHHGRTVLSRGYGLADRERGIRHHEGIAFTLSSAGKPFKAVALLQLVAQGRLRLTDTVGAHLPGFPAEIADRVTVHHLLGGMSGLNTPDENRAHVFQSREEVHEYWTRWARRARPLAPPGTPSDHAGSETVIPALIIEAVSGMTYWDYVEEHIFRRSGMTGSAFYTRPQWLTDPRLAHPYMTLADGTQVDALHHLDQGSPDRWVLDRNPGRAFIDAPGDGGFASATDLVRFARALTDGTLLPRPWFDVLSAPNLPHGPTSFGAYGYPVHISGSQWTYGRAGGNPGVAAAWNIYPDTGWVGVILANTDGLPLAEMSRRETEAITGVLADDGESGG